MTIKCVNSNSPSGVIYDFPDGVFVQTSLTRLCQTNAQVVVTKEDGTVLTYFWVPDQS